MSFIRPLESDDLQSVAAMFQRQLRAPGWRMGAGLADYLRLLFLAGPFADAALPSLVYQRADGSIGGFVGITSQPMALGERRLQVAVCGALMVDGHDADPMAGARLLKAALAGPQDLTLSETAGDTTLAMWRQLRGEVLSRHSLDWVRVIRPAGFAVETAGRRFGAARAAAPLARFFDRRFRQGRGARQHLRWAALPLDLRLPGGVEIVTPDWERFARMVRDHTEAFPLRRDWSDAALAQLIEDVQHKSDYGPVRVGLVQSRSGAALGGFIYHGRPGATARVLDVLARPERAGVVLDCLLHDAAEQGAIAVRGRTSPASFDALLERRCLMFRHSASVVAGRDRDLVDRVMRGEAAFNGVVGERWSRLIGDGLD
jgi:hypothetical protein